MLLFAQDNVFVMVAAVVQYRCGKDKVEDAFYTLYNPHQQIEAYVNDGELLRLEYIWNYQAYSQAECTATDLIIISIICPTFPPSHLCA